MKRFFQGLGVGILGTTLIFSIAYYTIGNKKITDAQIINEAGKLGMVKATEAPLFTDNQGEQTPDDTQQQAQPRQEVHTMPDGMSCAQDMHRAGKTGFKGISGGMDTEVLRQAVVLSEILAEPVCKRRHRRNRHTI